MKSENEPVVEKVGAYLKQQARELDQDTEHRLDQIRAQAVAMAEQRQPRSWFVGAGYAAVFSVAVIAGLVVLKTQTPEQSLNTSPLELVLVNEDFEMLEQDLAFYSWVETELADQG